MRQLNASEQLIYDQITAYIIALQTQVNKFSNLIPPDENLNILWRKFLHKKHPAVYPDVEDTYTYGVTSLQPLQYINLNYSIDKDGNSIFK